MNFYTELTILESTEISTNFILSKVFEIIHISLVKNKDQTGFCKVGISFPLYQEKKGLGTKLRLFSIDKEDIEKLELNFALEKLKDYVHITGIRDVPKNIKSYSVYERIQPKLSNAKINRIIKRKSEREKITIEAACLYYTDLLLKDKDYNLKYPYINLKSSSTNQKFKLFIKKEKANEERINLFTTYGLNNTLTDKNSTVPEF